MIYFTHFLLFIIFNDHQIVDNVQYCQNHFGISGTIAQDFANTFKYSWCVFLCRSFEEVLMQPAVLTPSQQQLQEAAGRVDEVRLKLGQHVPHQHRHHRLRGRRAPHEVRVLVVEGGEERVEAVADTAHRVRVREVLKDVSHPEDHRGQVLEAGVQQLPHLGHDHLHHLDARLQLLGRLLGTILAGEDVLGDTLALLETGAREEVLEDQLKEDEHLLLGQLEHVLQDEASPGVHVPLPRLAAPRLHRPHAAVQQPQDDRQQLLAVLGLDLRVLAAQREGQQLGLEIFLLQQPPEIFFVWKKIFQLEGHQYVQSNLLHSSKFVTQKTVDKFFQFRASVERL